MIDLFPVLYFNEGASCAPNVFEVEGTVTELDLSVVTTDALVENQDLVGAVPSNFGALLLY